MTVFFQRRSLAQKRDFKGVLVVNKDAGVFVRFQGVSETLWESLKKPISHAQLVKIVCSEYSVDVKTASRDLESFLHEALGAGLVEKIEK